VDFEDRTELRVREAQALARSSQLIASHNADGIYSVR
jgi:hypothetical protein